MSNTYRGHLVLGLLFALLCGAACREPAAVEVSVDQLIQRCANGESNELILHDAVNAEQWAQILTLKRLVALELHRCAFRSIAGIEALQQLHRLRLEDFQCDDTAVKGIAQLSELRVLNLPQSSLSDDGVEQLANMAQLELLRFGSPHVTDAGVAKLADAPSLRFLHLIRVNVTDEGLQAFHNMKQLESFYIDAGKETEEGIWQLLQANPELHFHRDQLHLPNDPHADGH